MNPFPRQPSCISYREPVENQLSVPPVSSVVRMDCGDSGVRAGTAWARRTPRSFGSRLTPYASRLLAFSLIEVMIATTLMSVIVLGLLVMFGQTQRAFRLGVTQVDVMEAGRAALEMMAREIEQATPCRMPAGPVLGSRAVNLIVRTNGTPAFVQDLPGGNFTRTNFQQDIIFLIRDGQRWKGVGYAILGNNAVGTLSRTERNISVLDLPPNDVSTLGSFTARQIDNFRVQNLVTNSIMDGVVHLRFRLFDHLGRPIEPFLVGQAPYPNLLASVFYEAGGALERHIYYSAALPAHVEIELGILERSAVERARALPSPAQEQFLRNRANQVQIFRQRVPLRHADPALFQ